MAKRAKALVGGLLVAVVVLAAPPVPSPTASQKCPVELSNLELLPDDEAWPTLLACIQEARDGAVPTGAVMAFTIPCSDVSPKGDWKFFNEAGGRFVIGAGDHNNKWIDSITGKEHDIGVYVAFGNSSVSGKRPPTGGEEEHMLTNQEMPSHSHYGLGKSDKGWKLGIKGPPTNQGLKTGTFLDNDNYFYNTSEEGGSRPHNNMPPYIALYFCKKE